MSQDLLLLSFGPVQPFLAASRRTRDLANGSKLLLFAVRAAARALVENADAELIIPAWSPGESWDLVDAANLVEALIPAGRGPEAANLAREAALDYLKRKWLKVIGDNPNLGLDEMLGTEQIEALLEFYAGWAPVEGSFEDARRLAGQLLNASKNVRMRVPCPQSMGRPKSPLLPQFESVVPVDGGLKVKAEVSRRLLLGPRETLDGPSLTKRFLESGGGDVSSTRHMASVGLLMKGEGSRELQALVDLANEASDERARISPADILHLDNDLRSELELKLVEGFASFWNSLGEARRSFLRRHNEGRPARGYFAVIHADGDGMGKARSCLSTAEDHKLFSRAVKEFSKAVPGIVSSHHGYCVLAGGDDVLALASLDDAIPLAADLAKKFEDCMKGQEARIKDKDRPKVLTLSVGLAFAHYSAKLSDVVGWSHDLETRAKKEGKARLTVGARVRSGNDLVHSLAWEQKPDIVARKVMAAMGGNDMPRGFAKEVYLLGTELSALERDLGSPLPLDHVLAEYGRLCKKKISGKSQDLIDLWSEELQKSPHRGAQAVSHSQSLAEFGGLLKLCHFVTRVGGEE